jgi:hypothetical protein
VFKTLSDNSNICILAPHDDKCGTIVMRPLKRVIFMLCFDFPLSFKSLTQHPTRLNNIEHLELFPLKQRHHSQFNANILYELLKKTMYMSLKQSQNQSTNYDMK